MYRLYYLVYYLGGPSMIMLLLIIAAVIAAVVWAVSVSNRFKVLLVKINEADSGIDVALNKRYDTLVKLMDVVRAYAKHEVETLSGIVELRSGMGLTEKVQAQIKMDEVSNRINAIVESYPELRSSENFKQLQDAILESEDYLQAARRVYNAGVSAFNQAIVRFPDSIIANRSGYKQKYFFEVSNEKRSDVKINL